MKTYAYLPDYIATQKNWALESQNVFYGDDELKGIFDKPIPAIIDTGSSTLAVPAKTHNVLIEKMRDQITPDKIDCVSGQDFC